MISLRHPSSLDTLCLLSIAAIAVVTVIGCSIAPRHAAVISAPPVAPASAESPALAPVLASDWIEFRGEDDDFRAMFPPGSSPQRLDDAVNTPIGSQKIVRFVSDADAASFDAGYLIRSSSPLAALAGDTRILESACNGTAKYMGGRVLASVKCEVDGHMARDIEIELPADATHPDGAHASVRLILTDDRIFHAIVRHHGGTTRAPDADRFIASLRMIDSEDEQASNMAQAGDGTR